MYKRKARILFLSAGNACQSQMAETYANALGAHLVDAKSAVIAAHEKNPHAIAVMQADKVDISPPPSKVSSDMLEWADLLVIISEQANDHCLSVPVHVQKKHWPVRDPTKTKGTEQVKIAEFLIARDEIKRRVLSMLGGLKMMGKN